MGRAAAVLFGGGGAPMLKLDRRQGSVTNAKTTVRRGGKFAVDLRVGPLGVGTQRRSVGVGDFTV